MLLRHNDNTKLIVRHILHKTLHGRIRDTLTELRTKFWVTASRQANHKGVCSLQAVQLKGSKSTFRALPATIISQAQPFEVMGVYFMGPLQQARQSMQENTMKIFIPTCAVTRAAHLEIVKICHNSEHLTLLSTVRSKTRNVPGSLH